MMATFLSSNPMMCSPCNRAFICRHGRPCAGHPRLSFLKAKTWMPGTSPGMTKAIWRIAAYPSPQHRTAALDDRDVARLHLGLERNDVAVLPHLHGHGLAGKHWRREPRRVLFEG